jgi:hypothetical protein
MEGILLSPENSNIYRRNAIIYRNANIMREFLRDFKHGNMACKNFVIAKDAMRVLCKLRQQNNSTMSVK